MIDNDFLTKTPLYGEREIADSKLISFENPNKGRCYEISVDMPEFTCLCPFSGYPDFAKIFLKYQPGEKVLELKSLKLYVNSYRNRKISHEEVANQIMDDLVAEIFPEWMELEADFNPRGNIHMVVRVCHGRKKSI